MDEPTEAGRRSILADYAEQDARAPSSRYVESVPRDDQPEIDRMVSELDARIAQMSEQLSMLSKQLAPVTAEPLAEVSDHEARIVPRTPLGGVLYGFAERCEGLAERIADIRRRVEL